MVKLTNVMIINSSISFLKLRHLLNNAEGRWGDGVLEDTEMGDGEMGGWGDGGMGRWGMGRWGGGGDGGWGDGEVGRWGEDGTFFYT
ncbi:hypothetical protein [Okeania sp. KiyG1]|uniref:hypothetical protein n=1 Tax=Okeania sp. KiyG1 TaxID=2720165 RepID=UPI0019211118|nr:hypothetical protein [Okeania sp. KiyG1]